MNKWFYKTIEKVKKINILKVIFIFVGICLVLESTSIIAQAGMMDAIGSPDIFQSLSGDAKYLSSAYRSNYYLDTVSLGMTDLYGKAVKFISNLVWDGAVTLTYLTILAFHFSFSMDLANMFMGTMEAILNALKVSIFDRYWLLFIAIAFIFAAISFIRGNLSQSFSRIAYMVVALCLSVVTVKYATPIVSNMATISKGIGSSSVISISSGGVVDSDPTAQADREIAKISGELWVNLVHKPWLDLEGDNKLTSEQVEKILSLNPKSKDRQNYIDEINKSDETLFEETAGEGRIFPAIIILVVNLVKMVILFLISIVQIAFQVFAILLVFALPFTLLLSVVPAFGGVGMVGSIGKQILSTQIGIILTSLLLGVIIQIDSLIGNLFKTSTQYGWFFASFMQAALFLGIVWQRKQIFNILASIQRKFGRTGTGVWYGARRSADKIANKGSEKIEEAKQDLTDLRSWASSKISAGATNAANGIRNFSSRMNNSQGTPASTTAATAPAAATNAGSIVPASHDSQNNDNIKPKRRVIFLNDDKEKANEDLKNNMDQSVSEKGKAEKKSSERISLKDRIDNNSSRVEDIRTEKGTNSETYDNDNIVSKEELDLAREKMARGESIESLYADDRSNTEYTDNTKNTESVDNTDNTRSGLEVEKDKDNNGKDLKREEMIEKSKGINDTKNLVEKDLQDGKKKELKEKNIDGNNAENVKELDKGQKAKSAQKSGKNNNSLVEKKELKEKNIDVSNKEESVKELNREQKIKKSKNVKNNSSNKIKKYENNSSNKIRKYEKTRENKSEVVNDKLNKRDINEKVNKNKDVNNDKSVTQQDRANMFSKKFKKGGDE